MAAGREFDLIRSFYPDETEPRADVAVGPGDDAAVVVGAGIVLSTDLSVEGVHFRRDWLGPREIGARAATAALSDLAAMAARPIGVLVSMALPESDLGGFAEEVMAGVREAVGRVGGALLGGDVSASADGLVMDFVAVGEAATPILRVGAQPGDEVWVTGRLGGSAWAIEQLAGGRTPEPTARARFASPTARTAEARWLAERSIPVAMLDLSDGLAGDAGHLARAGGVAVVLEAEAVPIHEALGARAPVRALQLALTGGEDYELLFAARPGSVAPHAAAFANAFGCTLTRVGMVEAGKGVFLRDAAGSRNRLSLRGYQHFHGEP